MSRLKRIAVITAAVLMTLFLFYMLLRNNIHTVAPGVLYRSAQLSPSRLKRLIHRDHIQTIINLRGANPQYTWYRGELSVSRSMAVAHYDIRLAGMEKPTPKQLRRLIQLFRTAPRPIVIHCQGGADRTGFATSMWMLMKGRSVAEARHAFSIRYFVHNPRSIGKLVMPIYKKWLTQHHYKSNSSHFLKWVATTQLVG